MPTAKYITQRRKIQPIYLFTLVFPCNTGHNPWYHGEKSEK
jgi:hypothetical protein